jgi:hypothetical protein
MPGMRAVPAELRDRPSALILIKLRILDLAVMESFSASSVSEYFHVANFGWAPHPFFFLAPSRQRGRGYQGIPDTEIHPRRICFARSLAPLPSRGGRGLAGSTSALLNPIIPFVPPRASRPEIAWERYPNGPRRMAEKAQE